MDVNVGNADRNARIIIGMLLIAASLFNVIGLWGFIGIAAVATGLMRHCPAYRLLGYNSASAKAS